MRFPTWPPNLYRVTQGLHVATGIAAIPLLLAKLWTVYPLLFAFPPFRSIGQALERISIAILISSAAVQLATGVLNTYQWYPFPFAFRDVHYALSWIIVGSLILHVAVTPAEDRALLARPTTCSVSWGRRWHARRGPVMAGVEQDRALDGTEEGESAQRVGRRAFLGTVGAATAAVTVLTVGQSLAPLRGTDLFGARNGRGPQGLPVNATAAAVGVEQRATDPQWQLQLTSPVRSIALSRDELLALPQTEARLPIACVEGWSVGAHWSGVRLADLMDLVRADPTREIRVRSLQPAGGLHRGRHGAGIRPPPVHPAGARAQRADAEPRPRVPRADDRPEPARSVPDQVGGPDRGPPMRLLRRGVLGLGFVIVGVFGLAEWFLRRHPAPSAPVDTATIERLRTVAVPAPTPALARSRLLMGAVGVAVAVWGAHVVFRERRAGQLPRPRRLADCGGRLTRRCPGACPDRAATGCAPGGTGHAGGGGAAGRGRLPWWRAQ